MFRLSESNRKNGFLITERKELCRRQRAGSESSPLTNERLGWTSFFNSLLSDCVVEWYTCRESNPNLRNRNPLFYPLNYRCAMVCCQLIGIAKVMIIMESSKYSPLILRTIDRECRRERVLSLRNAVAQCVRL